MHKYAQNMHKICSSPISMSPVHLYAFICICMQKHGRYVSMEVIYKICKKLQSSLC